MWTEQRERYIASLRQRLSDARFAHTLGVEQAAVDLAVRNGVDMHRTATAALLHDYAKGYANSVVDIRNGHITGREIGGTGDILGLEYIRNASEDNGTYYNFIEYTKEGKTLRSSTLFLRDEDGNPSVCIAINEDITKSLELERYLHSRNRVDTDQPNEGKYRGDVNDMLQHLMDQAQLMVGKNSAHMTKEDKLRYLEFLDKHGAFLITYSNAQVCKALNISQFSLYNYLRMIRGGKDGAAEPLPMGK